ncbi:VanZ family protein [Bacillus marasmi]|uniref:VanZ family protein n=1 Tax=Bacillus marasmi TaxID=1926279 RepID=UPI001FEA3099|nr:VanZ family protein [Bacillus marasmi]
MGSRKWTFMLFIIYGFVLIWLVLFKLQFSFDHLDRVRVMNMIPLHHSVLSEVYANIWIFVPFGIFISMLKRKWPFMKKLVSIFGVTLAFETIQFVLVIGRSDITDVLANTLGGIIGISIYELLFKLIKHRTNKTINLFASVVTSIVMLFLIFIFKRP